MSKDEIMSYVLLEKIIEDRYFSIGELNGFNIVITRTLKNYIEKTNSNNLYRFHLYLDETCNPPKYRIDTFSEWDEKDWSMDNLILNLEALDLHRSILVREGIWCDIYNNPGKDWSDIYCNFLV